MMHDDMVIDVGRLTASPSRAVVVGPAGSGETTLARCIARLLDVPHIELDALNWGPNWQQRPTDEFRALVNAAVAQEQWIADGNYSRARDIIWNRARVVIWLNYPFLTVFWRALRRAFVRAVAKEELWSGNRESFRQSFFSRDSILWWVVTSFRLNRTRYRAVFQQNEFPHLTVMELTNRGDAVTLLSALEREVADME